MIVGRFDIDKFKDISDKLKICPYSSGGFGVLAQGRKINLLRSGETINPGYGVFKDEVEYTLSVMERIYGVGECTMMLLLTMPPGGEIPMHTDKGEANSPASRHHFPITTNEHCIMKLGNRHLHMEIGNVYCIDTFNILHGSENNGVDDRTHLIVDWIC